ncbi:hypothetical protein AWZ03_009417 [Drosophila navojoa]|uniref:Uncharacterized protein n=1 Tax=Drosophila navojoa TaxID=7232 RepID=A0A484B7V2_DRONA|nr:hypothetical protein AWZ03_009417 [Drosophila navojoa]
MVAVIVKDFQAPQPSLDAPRLPHSPRPAQPELQSMGDWELATWLAAALRCGGTRGQANDYDYDYDYGYGYVARCACSFNVQNLPIGIIECRILWLCGRLCKCAQRWL